MKKKENNIILGAGITGLAAGFKTGYPIYEASAMPGGICRSYYRGGYRFENGGGHWIFGEGKPIDFISEFVTLKKYKRNASVIIEEKIPYPIQNYFEIEEEAKHGTLKGWLRGRFGNDLCRLFFYPFNKKYTDGLFDMVVQDDIGKSPIPRMPGYNDCFYYPAEGLDNLVAKLALKCDIKFRKKAVDVNLKEKIVLFSDGDSVKYDRLISTIPLKELLRLTGQNSPSLLYTSVNVLNVGGRRGRKCPDEHWLYIPQKDARFHRIGIYTNVDQSFSYIKDGVSFYVETAYTGQDENPEPFLEGLAYLKEKQWLAESDVFDENWIKYAYTWMKNKLDREKYIAYLKEYGIFSIGRYGKWKFQGMAESINDGLETE